MLIENNTEEILQVLNDIIEEDKDQNNETSNALLLSSFNSNDLIITIFTKYTYNRYRRINS